MSSETVAAEPVLAAPSEQDVVLRLRGVGKSYPLFDGPSGRLRELLFGGGRLNASTFTALSDVSFDLRRGQTLGVIGRNGSGKSTLLQVIAGIVEPTEGKVERRGRVAALLELGSGFNPEFTGRENVLMSAAILGLSPAQIEARFDEIAAFADIGDFMDRPVKLYSTGMFLRLAFAVNVSVEADLLLIDEALAVGDVFFRQKCYRHLEKLRQRGVAIVLVSHAMTEVEQFCDSAILLDAGRVLFAGSAAEAVKRYYLVEQGAPFLGVGMARGQSGGPPSGLDTGGPSEPHIPPEALFDLRDVPQVTNGWARCVAVALLDADAQARRVFGQGERARFIYEFELLENIQVPIGGVVLQNDKGVIVHGKSTLEYDTPVPMAVPKGHTIRFLHEIDLELAPGEYTFEVGLASLSPEDYARRGEYPHQLLHTRITRITHLPTVGRFAVVFRKEGAPVQLLHHGVANLPGSCRMRVSGPR